MTKSFILPADIMTLIFQYDNTFKELFSTKVLPQIWGSVLKRNVKSQKLNKYKNIFNKGDSFYSNDNGKV